MTASRFPIGTEAENANGRHTVGCTGRSVRRRFDQLSLGAASFFGASSPVSITVT